MVEPSPSVDSYYAYEDTVGLDHLSKLEPVDSLVEPSYEELEEYIRSTDYYANIDAINPNVQVMTMDEDTIFIHFNSNNDQGLMISSSEYGYIIQRSYLVTQRFTYTKNGQTRQAEMNVTNRKNYFEDAPLPNEYFISLVVPDSDNQTNYQIYYDQTRQSFYTVDANDIYDETITFSLDLENKMVDTMGYISSALVTLDNQGMQFVVDLLFDYYQLPYVLLASPSQGISDPHYHQTIFLNKTEFDPYEAGFIPYDHCDPKQPYNDIVMINRVYMDIVDLDADHKLYTIVNVEAFHHTFEQHEHISIGSYVNNHQIDPSDLIDKYSLIDEKTMIGQVRSWFDHYRKYVGIEKKLLENTQLSIEAYQKANLIEWYGVFNDHFIFSIRDVEGVKDVLVSLPIR